jgi:aryl carrier-like protein
MPCEFIVVVFTDPTLAAFMHRAVFVHHVLLDKLVQPKVSCIAEDGDLRMLRLVCLASFCCVAAALPTTAQDFPKFDGIYLGLKDGTFEKLSPFSPKRIIVAQYGSRTVAGGTSPFYPIVVERLAAEQDILSAIFFDSENAESIFIRSRSMRLNFIENVVPVQDIFFDFSSDEDNLRRDAFYQRLNSGFPYIAGTTCGVQASSLNLLNESETTYQYFFDGSNLLDQGADDVKLFYRESNGCFAGGATDASKSLGLILSTNSESFLLLETDAMRDYYASPTLQGWTALSKLTGKIEDADK